MPHGHQTNSVKLPLGKPLVSIAYNLLYPTKLFTVENASQHMINSSQPSKEWSVIKAM